MSPQTQRLFRIVRARRGKACYKIVLRVPIWNSPLEFICLARIIHDQWIIRAIFMIYLDKLVHTQKHPAYRFQIWFRFELEYLEVYRGFGGVAPKVTGFGE